jgi:hypothetical protein
MVYHCIKLYTFKSRNLLVIAIKPTAEDIFFKIAILIFCVLRKEEPKESYIFFEDPLPYFASRFCITSS